MSDRRIELASIETVSLYVNDLHELLSKSSLAERRAFVRSFVKEIIVTGNEVLLNYTVPLPQIGLKNEKAGVLPIVHYGRPFWSIDRTVHVFKAVFAFAQV